MSTCVLMSLMLNLGQAVAADSSAAKVVLIGSVWDFVLKGGPVMIPIGIASLVALAVFVERAWLLRRRAVIPPTVVAGLQSALSAHRFDVSPVLELCQRSPSALGNIIMAGIRNIGQSTDVLEKRIGEAGEREVFGLRKHLRVLSLVGSIATLLGLLGTITGMISAFQTVAASGEALGKTELLAKGIYEAMITTAAGLIVAIPTMIAYHYLTARIEFLIHEMDRIAVDFVERVVNPGVSASSAAVTPSAVAARISVSNQADQAEPIPQAALVGA